MDLESQATAWLGCPNRVDLARAILEQIDATEALEGWESLSTDFELGSVTKAREALEKLQCFESPSSYIEYDPNLKMLVKNDDYVTPEESAAAFRLWGHLREMLIEQGFLDPNDKETNLIALVGVLLP